MFLHNVIERLCHLFITFLFIRMDIKNSGKIVTTACIANNANSFSFKESIFKERIFRET